MPKPPMFSKLPVNYSKSKQDELPKVPARDNLDFMLMEPPPAKKAKMIWDSVKKEFGIIVKNEFVDDNEFPQSEIKSEIDYNYAENEKPPVILPTVLSSNQTPPKVQRIGILERNCEVCLEVKRLNVLKEVETLNEKLIILLGMVVSSKISIDVATQRYSNSSKLVICNCHYGESGEQIMKALAITSPDRIFSTSRDRLQLLHDYVNEIRGKLSSLTAFKRLFTLYCHKYSPIKKKSLLPRSLQRNRKTNDSSITQKLQEMGYNKEQLTTPEILPKSQRQPRKQKLEENDFRSEDMVIRRFIPISFPKSTTSQIGNSRKCSYCNNIVSRSDSIRVPRSETRREAWYDKLGVEFERNVKYGGNNFICRAHFDESAFTKTNRLDKNAMPYKIGELVFYKVVEDHLNISRKMLKREEFMASFKKKS